MSTRTGFSLVLLALSCLVGSCKQQSRSQHEQDDLPYDYRVAVEDMNPFAGVQASFVVETRFSNQTGHEQPALYALSNYQVVSAKEKNVFPATRQVPFDTRQVDLRRGQMDTIYQLARAIFQLPTTPSFRTAASRAYPPMHDMDNYLRVHFTPQSWTGPSFSCSGYEENNAATYALHAHLSRLKEQALRRGKQQVLP